MATSSHFAYSLFFILSYVTYRLIRWQIERQRVKQFAREHGCADPEDRTGPFPYGFSMLWRVMNMDRTGEDLLDDIMAEEFGDVNTFKKTTREPAIMKALLATQFKDFESGARRRNILYPMIGQSIFSSDGAFWQHSRALFRPQFSRDNINDLEATGRHCDALIQAIEASSGGKTGWTPTVTLMPLIYNFTMDTASEFLFGESLNAQAQSFVDTTDKRPSEAAIAAEARSKMFLRAFDQISRTVADRFRLQGLYFLADGLKFRKAIADLRKVTDHFVQRAVKQSAVGNGKDGLPGSKIKYNLLSALARETTNEEELRNQVIAILFAGRDTTAATLGWCISHLALRPDTLTRVRTAVLEHFGEEVSSNLDFAQLKACRPLQHFINEVLRLHSVVPINGRFAIKDTTIPIGGGPDEKSPIVIRRGQFVLFNVHLMHRRKDLWGEDALEFRPERWEERTVPAWHYLPFNGGPRVCLGQQFALTEISYVLVRLLQRYVEIEPVVPEEMAKLKKSLSLTSSPAGGVRVRFHRAGT